MTSVKLTAWMGAALLALGISPRLILGGGEAKSTFDLKRQDALMAEAHALLVEDSPLI